jgi:hypothetical protein
MSRVIGNNLAMVANITQQSQKKAIELAGGFLCPENPNRKLRRRMQREGKRQVKLMAKKNNKEILDNSQDDLIKE